MELVFIRHAEPAWIQGGRGVDNPGLTERGHDQARRLAKRLEPWRGAVDEVWVSPLVRAQETAAPILDALEIAPQTRPWLKEARAPTWEGKPWEEVREFFKVARHRSVAAWWAGHEGGEPLIDFVARIADGLDGELGERGASYEPDSHPRLWRGVPQGPRVLVVAHAGTIGAALSHLMGLRQVPWAWERFGTGHASMATTKTVAIAGGLIFGLERLNDREHLDEPLRTR